VKERLVEALGATVVFGLHRRDGGPAG
jgi:hypothetical protein